MAVADVNRVTSVNLRVPITALASFCLNDVQVTLVGQGRFVLLYHHDLRTAHDRVQVFRGTSVHAIKALADRSLLVTGGKSVARLGLIDGKLSSTADEAVLSDWIWDSGQSGDHLLFLTAHNRVVVANMQLEVKGIYGAEEQCILYSGLLRKLNRNIVIEPHLFVPDYLFRHLLQSINR
jgi:hypothetical protein